MFPSLIIQKLWLLYQLPWLHRFPAAHVKTDLRNFYCIVDTCAEAIFRCIGKK